jgi:hypothetical protein
MNKAAKIAAIVAIVGVTGWLAHLHVISQTYYPLLQMSSPDGLVYTAVHDETAERQTCGAVNDRFIEPVRANCKNCEVVYARCDRELSGLDAALMATRPVPHHVVRSPGLRLAISGPAAAARESCDFIASDLLKRGYRSATCLYPQPAVAQGK